jgi:hypothetical protein
MPRLYDAAAMMRALNAAVNDRQHWIFLTDVPAGHAMLQGLVLGLILAEGADPTYGTFRFACPRDGWHLALSVALIPKQVLGVARINEFLKFIREDVPETDGSQDVFPLLDGTTLLERIHAVFSDAAQFVQATTN